jgi:hypothetical protein
MSALTGDLGEIAGLFAGLAAVIGVFRCGASASGMRTFGWRLDAHLIPPSFQAALRRPRSKSMTKITNATTTSK